MRALRNRRQQGRQSGISLIELLVSMVVMGILSTLILMVWFTLQSSYASSEQNAVQRDDARQALWRMAAEIRDAQGVGGGAPVTSAAANTIVITTSFNNAGNTDQPTDPTATDTNVHRVRYSYNPSTRRIYRTEDTNFDGSFADKDQVVYLNNVVNCSIPSSYSEGDYLYTPIFRYSYYDTGGTLRTVNNMAEAVPPVDTSQLLNVQIRLLVDVKPNKSPTYMDLQTTVQPRNALR